MIAEFGNPLQETASNYLYSNEEMTGILPTVATTFYFSGKECAENPKLNDAKTQLVYSAQIGEFFENFRFPKMSLKLTLGTYEHSDSIVTAPAMLFSQITCNYDEDVANVFQPGANGVKLDPETDKDQVADADQGDLGITVAKFKRGTHDCEGF